MSIVWISFALNFTVFISDVECLYTWEWCISNGFGNVLLCPLSRSVDMSRVWILHSKRWKECHEMKSIRHEFDGRCAVLFLFSEKVLSIHRHFNRRFWHIRWHWRFKRRTFPSKSQVSSIFVAAMAWICLYLEIWKIVCLSINSNTQSC